MNFSPSGFEASSLANFNDAISMISTTRLFIYNSCSLRHEPTFVMASQLTLLGDSTVNIKSTRRAFGFFLPAEYTVMYTCYQRGVTVLGCGQFLPFIIKRILGIKRIFPCGFGNKHMRLLTRVYSNPVPRPHPALHCLQYGKAGRAGTCT